MSSFSQLAQGYWGYVNDRDQMAQVRFNSENLFLELEAQIKAEKSTAQINERNMRERAGVQQASIQSAYSKSGVLTTSGTPLAMMEDQAARDEQDIQQMKQDSRFQQKMLRRAAQNTMIEAKMQMKALLRASHEKLIGGIFGS